MFPESFPILETRRLVLREILNDDQQQIFKGLSHPEVIKYYGISYSSYKESSKQMTWYKRLWEEKSGIWWGITLKEKTELIGTCGLFNYSARHCRAETGFWLLPEFWHFGYTSEAVKAIFSYAYIKLEMHRIEALVEKENLASLHLLKKLRFKYEGTLRDYEKKGDRYIPVELFSLLKNEFKTGA